jgi:malate permease and related proteins
VAGQIDLVLNQIVIFAILMAIGFVAAKANALNRDVLNALSKLIVIVLLPALIFSIIADSGVTTGAFLDSGWFAVGAALCYTLLITAGFVMVSALKLKGKTANIFLSLSTFGNMGFMGIPLLLGVFRDPVTQVSISIFTVFDMALLWTFGVYLCSRHRENANPVAALKNMVNPTTVALLIGFVVMAFQVPVPDVLMNTISGVGNTSKSLTLIYIGGVLAFISIGNIIRKPNIFLLTVVKMLALPIIAYFLLGFFLQGVSRMILTVIVGLPAMTTVAMIAANYESDVEYATEIIFVTTLASLVTIPLIFLITSAM